MRSKFVKKLVRMGLLCALSIVLVYLVHFPIFPSAPFLEYDMADVPIFIGAFMYGPASGLVLTAVVSVLQWLLISPQSGWVGAVMHFFATGAFVVAAGLIYRHFHTRKGAFLGLIAGTLSMTLMMIPLNLVFTVHFYGTPAEVVRSMMLPVIIPFNLIKAAGNSVITFLLYKSVGSALRLERGGAASTKGKAEPECGQ
ncbi:MAG: Riboflavin transporter RibU [Firmicutes bacterium ADurb.Bin182]|nr:MAG: Riboflavin transporter RibU [Firmicutes bacterium ADurb.Bin182]